LVRRSPVALAAAEPSDRAFETVKAGHMNSALAFLNRVIPRLVFILRKSPANTCQPFKIDLLLCCTVLDRPQWTHNVSEQDHLTLSICCIICLRCSWFV
jgi:hypothetical protein